MTGLLTPDEAAEMLGVPRARILALVRGRAIGSVRVGPRTVRIPPEALEAWIRRAYNPAHEEAQGESERRGKRLPVQGPKAPLARNRHRRVDARRPAGPPVPLPWNQG